MFVKALFLLSFSDFFSARGYLGKLIRVFFVEISLVGFEDVF